ncbi:GNAT family N-acetyltransferase [Chitinophaga nivalis]|uniref:GNAT family N-acetyltransferase n=1 Tax=Chitinophaga nivalis TaxID=2991709 RepID=A0ABT3IKU7_9BACT|nr:GNAT family N-acetyltransferase [Chitinophaga nivalis]MCW3465718.1 GNAT family N-acetyltransferase [Chitinophaga nivalis]MCW3484591.1 GNAT family N-acetyltransferase [Chitinophaga nivalis]
MNHPTTLESTEINALLALQHSNLVQHLEAAAAASQGFLTFQYSETDILRMMKDMPQPITKAGDDITGYALATSPAASNDIEIMNTMVKLTAGLSLNGTSLSDLRYYFMGQVCVKEGHRGQGIFDKLYEHHRELFADTYDCLVTEISAANLRSQAAHARVGFQTIHSYADEQGIDWLVVAWDWRVI